VRFNKITIIGVGLIGGSIGLAVKRHHIAKEVIGVFRRNSTLNKALKRGAVDKTAMSVKEGVKNADFIILATPVSLIPSMAREAVRYAKKSALITDVGSTKKWIVDRIEATNRKALFVGSHPMAGSEHAGVEFATADLLKGSPCIVTKTGRTNARALRKIASFWRALGAKVSVMSPEAHDRSVALISHLPHIVAFGLAGAVPAKELKYAAEGFKDTTRVALSDARLWADIFLSNRKEIVASVRAFDGYYKKLIAAITKGKYQETVRLLEKAKEIRSFLRKQESKNT
jgi:prephenate dehydrogenase